MGVFLLLVLVGMCLISDAWPSYNSEVDYVNGVPTRQLALSEIQNSPPIMRPKIAPGEPNLISPGQLEHLCLMKIICVYTR